MATLCPYDGNPIEIPELETNFSFPDDVGHIIDVIEGRFNTIVHQECQQRISFQTEVAVLDREGRAFIVVDPDEEGLFTAEVRKIAAENEVDVVVVDDLRAELLDRLNRYVLPAVQACMADDSSKPPKSMDLLTPLVLRLLKSSIDGYASPFLQFNDATPERATELLHGFYGAILSDQVVHIARDVSRRSDMLSLLTAIESRVPPECLTSEVLQSLREKCSGFVTPDEKPGEYPNAYFHEYVNAVAHAVAGQKNPRSLHMAAFLGSAWTLNHRGHAVDPQFLLNASIARRIVQFGELWDLAMKGLERSPDFQRGLSEGLGLLKYYGFEQEALAVMRTGALKFDDAKPAQVSKLVEGLEERLLAKIQFNQDAATSETAGVLVAGSVRTLLRNGHVDGARQLVQSLLGNALKADDRTAAVAIAIEAADVFNGHELFSDSFNVTSSIMDLLSHANDLSPGLLIQAWTVVGNVLRYRFQHDAAIKAYSLALQMVDLTHVENSGAEHRNILERNMGIVYRDMGQYGKASTLLEQAAERDPQNHQIQHNLAVLYQNINRRGEALRCLDRAIDLAGGAMNDQVRRPYLLSRALLKLDMGKPEDGLLDLMAALKGAPTFVTKVRVAAAALQFDATFPEGLHFLKDCQDLVNDAVTNGAELQPSLKSLAYVQLADKLLREGAIEQTRAVLTAAQQWLKGLKSDTPWQMSFSLARLSHTLGDHAGCWAHLDAAWSKLESKVPAGEEAGFAAFWLLDKARYQSELTRIAVDLVEAGTVPSETLLAVYDFVNGREITSRLGAGNDGAMPRSQALAEAAQSLMASGSPVDVIFALETSRDVFLCVGKAEAGGWSVRPPHQLNADRIVAVRKAFETAIRSANPSDLESLDEDLKDWSELSAEIARATDGLQAGSHVVVLPGRALTGLPLHLVRDREGPLIDRHTVSYAPNLTALVAANRTRAARHTRALVVVTAEKDGAPFRQRAMESANRMIQLLGQSDVGVEYLQQEAADHDAVRNAMKTAGEILFLCHGTTAGVEGGYGICVAHGGVLPPRVLSVNEFPDHANYILTWRDIEEAPALFASIACSSGRTDVTDAGVRFGLEQSLFSAGTRTIISPMWDVDQESALYWMEILCQHRSSHPEWSLPQAYRQTCLDVRHKYDHFYHWGPFFLNGAFMEEQA